MISDKPPTLRPDTISPYSGVATDTQKHNARTTNIAHPQYTDTQSIISASAVDTQTTMQTHLPSTFQTPSASLIRPITLFYHEPWL